VFETLAVSIIDSFLTLFFFAQRFQLLQNTITTIWAKASIDLSHNLQENLKKFKIQGKNVSFSLNSEKSDKNI